MEITSKPYLSLSIENIHKVIDPLFLDDLYDEFATIKTIKAAKARQNKLKDFQDKPASLKFLDPACGSGNFLTETYLSLRRLENEVLKELIGAQITLGELSDPIKVSISQFYGIEINDFAVTVAKTALWIAESQMMSETAEIVHRDLDFLPLKTYTNIEEGNALQMDWHKIAPQVDYIMGNHPSLVSHIKLMSRKMICRKFFRRSKILIMFALGIKWRQILSKIQKLNVDSCRQIQSLKVKRLQDFSHFLTSRLILHIEPSNG